MRTIKVSDYVAEFLHAQGVRHVFELVGGMITQFVDSIHVQGDIQLISVHHEQAAAFAADAVGRVTGVPGVAMATSGPGATNLLTGIGSAYFDSSPTVFITGQVTRSEQKGQRAVRQLGFQETDIVPIVTPLTKAAWRVQNPEEIPGRLADAFRLALSGRPGPVLLDIPMDVQSVQISVEPASRVTPTPAAVPDASAIEQILDELAAAQRPLILVGGGIRAARAVEIFRRFADRVRVPVVNSLLAMEALPYQHPLRVGMIGSYGNRWANFALAEADYLLVLGSRLDVRQTGALTEEFKGSRTIVHVDCDTAEMNNRIKGCRAIVSELQAFLPAALSLADRRKFPEHIDWMKQIAKLKSAWPDTRELQDMPGINPNVFMHQLSAQSKAAGGYVADVGQHQMWAAQSLELESHQDFLTSGGMGAMGFGLPAAIGVALARPERAVVMIAGDGGFQLNLQELQTVVRNKLALKLVILNNRCHGMVRQFQQSYFGERYQSTFWGYSAPDFTQVAQAYGIAAATVQESSKVEEAVGAMWQDPGTPYLLQVMIDTMSNAYPKVAFGKPITEMEPFAKPVGMEST